MTIKASGPNVHLHIYPQFSQIPQDSYASIETEGLLGGQYLAISPGGLSTYLKQGSQILQTQSAIVLENLINKFFANFSSGSSSSGSSGGAAMAPATAAATARPRIRARTRRSPTHESSPIS